jgi:hypothetical protein
MGCEKRNLSVCHGIVYSRRRAEQNVIVVNPEEPFAFKYTPIAS